MSDIGLQPHMCTARWALLPHLCTAPLGLAAHPNQKDVRIDVCIGLGKRHAEPRYPPFAIDHVHCKDTVDGCLRERLVGVIPAPQHMHFTAQLALCHRNRCLQGCPHLTRHVSAYKAQTANSSCDSGNTCLPGCPCRSLEPEPFSRGCGCLAYTQGLAKAPLHNSPPCDKMICTAALLAHTTRPLSINVSPFYFRSGPTTTRSHSLLSCCFCVLVFFMLSCSSHQHRSASPRLRLASSSRHRFHLALFMSTRGLMEGWPASKDMQEYDQRYNKSM